MKLAPDEENFILQPLREKPLQIHLVLNESDIDSEDFDSFIEKLSQWLKDNFELSFNGYWWSEVDFKHYRSEIHDGKIVDENLDWLEDFSVEQIKKIRQFAETSFPEVIINQTWQR